MCGDDGEWSRYLVVVTTDPHIYIEQANLCVAYALGIVSGLLAAFIGTWRLTRKKASSRSRHSGQCIPS